VRIKKHNWLEALKMTVYLWMQVDRNMEVEVRLVVDRQRRNSEAGHAIHHIFIDA
jgi:hypothetical protein